MRVSGEVPLLGCEPRTLASEKVGGGRTVLGIERGEQPQRRAPPVVVVRVQPGQHVVHVGERVGAVELECRLDDVAADRQPEQLRVTPASAPAPRSQTLGLAADRVILRPRQSLARVSCRYRLR